MFAYKRSDHTDADDLAAPGPELEEPMSEQGEEPGEAPVIWVEITADDLAAENEGDALLLVVDSTPPLGSDGSAVGQCVTPSRDKLLLPPVKGCRIERFNLRMRYQAHYPGAVPASTSWSWSPGVATAAATPEDACARCADWCWQRFAEVHGDAAAASVRAKQLPRAGAGGGAPL